MPEINVNIKGIEKMEVKAKIVEDREEGQVVDKRVVTAVKFEFDGTPMMLNQVLLALANDHEVAVCFQSPQSIMSLEERKPEEAVV